LRLGYDHRQFGLRCILTPHHARDKGKESDAELGYQQAQHGNRGTAHGINLRINRDGANRRPRQNDRHHTGMHDVRPPAQSLVTEHRAQDELCIEHED